ncbi:calcineurin-binding protein cabin-1-like isoform X1 [Anneissia japonica]|uniref:calcineurin-binding protein cabin-1-like isoform X1 n=1 Tax=Anneissia japonica TaxID=1529436 RepID=UPI001425A3CC|nr:calcineurin-binding protein cabin-1-like isoform X1 [Anneissia japonica]
MIHIAALNDYSDDESETEPVIETTKEAQEAEAYALYNKALELQRGSLHQEAEVHYKRLLNTSLLTKAVASEDGKTEQILVQPGFMLKYSTYKNLASLASQKNDKKTAMEFYLEAVNIDSTDVSLWYKIGHLALELVHVPLARIAFEEAYQCNPKHWPSLDNLCTVLYALYDYPSCLYYIAKCFELDACYPKGHVLRKKIFSEQPALERDTLALFEQCNEWISDSNFISEDQSQKFVEEALDLRKTREQLSKKPAPILVKFQKPLKAFTWKCLGECLVSLYDYLDGSQRPLSFSCQVDLAGCLRKNDDEVMDTEPVVEQPQQKEEAPKDGVTDKVNLCHHQNDELSTAFPIDESVPASSSVLTSTLSSTQDTQGESQTIPMETDHDYAGSIINIEKNKRGPKRKRGLGDEPAPGKRRSARVRNTTTKKKEETINYQTLLQGFLPSSLRNVDDIDESSQDSCIASEENRSSTIESMTVSSPDIQQRKISWKASEESEVREFLEMCVDNNSGVIDMMSRYLINLSRRWSFKWPSGLASVFISCYEKFRKHLQLPSVFNNDSSAECLCDTGNMVLLYAELKLDQWIEKTSNLPTTITPKRIQTCTSSELLPSDLGHEFPAQFYHQDVTFTEQIATLPDVLSDKYEEYTIRVYWAKARLLVLDGKMECALESFDLCSELLTPQYKDNSSAGPVVVVLPNCNHDDTISLEQICKKKESLQRTQSLEEVRRLFDAGEYKKVSSILLPSLKQPLMKSKSICEQKSSERPSQILLLLQSLLKQQEYQECLSCAEIALIETIYEINHATNITSKEEWIEGVVQVCIAIDKTFASDKSIIKKLETGRLVRLTSNLIRIIEIAMETPEVGEFGQVSTVYPWILLYKLIKHEEDQIESMKIDTSDSTSESNRPCLPSSLMLLLTAHEYLGRRSWCCNDKGVFLKLHVSVLEEELFNRPEKDAHPFQSDLEHALEQSFYCLYSHPNRKAKAKHLVDHGVDELPLLWEDTKFLFEYFKPKILPEFDSYKTSTMSSELESLLLKISRIIPEQQNPANTIESLQAFIDGTTDVVPCIPPNKPVKLHVVQELYYLLADYNFKNKEWGKAIKFYLHDLCVNPERFDSWAGMAMARSTRLELKINSCDSKSEGTIYKQASTAARCFERALEIDASNSTLWMEYGSLSYMMQAYSSRKLKQLHEQGTISAETEEFLTTKKCELLKQAKKCYLRASECEGDGEEEEWLVYYMLGKIAEKEHALPQVYLDYYEKAARSLHENEARYPKKITYHNPADLALESLEIYFRIHTSVLKLLEFPDKSNIIDYKLLKKYISEARQFPFARGLEKKAEGRDYSTSDPDTDGKPVNPKTYNYQSSAGSQNSIQQLMDHNYFETSKRVSRTASQESTDTASDLDFFSSGDEPISPRPTDILLFHGGIRSAKPADVFHLLTDEKKSSLYKERFLEKTSEAVKSDVHGSTEKQIEQFAKTETSFKNPVVESSMGEEAIRDSSIVELYEESNSKRIISDESANDTNIISEGNLKDETAAFPKELAPRTIMDATVMAKDPSEMAMDKESADDTMNLEGNLKERIADMVFSSDAVIECVDNARNTAATAFKETTVSSKEFVPEMDTTVMSKETSETAMETDVVSKKFTTMFEEPLPSHSGISGISMEANIMDTVKTVGSNSVHDSEEENNLINSAMDQGNSVKDVVAMDTEKQTTNSDAHSTCAMQSDWQVSAYKDDYNIQANDSKGPTISSNQSKMLGAGTNPYRFKQKHVLGTTLEPSQHISKFQMAFLKSPLLCSKESVEESGFSQTESEDGSEIQVSEKPVEMSIETKIEDSKTIDQCSNNQLDSIVHRETTESVPEMHVIGNKLKSLPLTEVDENLPTPSQLNVTKSDQRLSTDDASSQTVAVGFSEIASNPVKGYHSLVKSKPEKDMNRLETAVDIEMEEEFFTSKCQDNKKKDYESMSASGITEKNDEYKEDLKDNERSQMEEKAFTLPTNGKEAGVEEEKDISENELFGHTREGNLERKEGYKDEILCVRSIRNIGITASNQHQSEGAFERYTKSIGLEENEGKIMEKMMDPNVREGHQEKIDRVSEKEDEENIEGADEVKLEDKVQGKNDTRDERKTKIDHEKKIKEEKMATNVKNENQESVDTTNKKEDLEKGKTDQVNPEEKSVEAIETTNEGKIRSENMYMEDPVVENPVLKDLSPNNCGDKDSFKTEESDLRNSEEHVQLINECLQGLKLCLSRFSQHYKALYRMAHVYHYVPTHKNDRWSRDTLLGTSTPWNQIPHLAAPALFADANKTKNFFQGIWRIPVEEIDRSGSFPSHMYRAISLLISVLLQLNDHQMLLQLSVKLNRTPELNKKYLRDQDRQFLSKQSYEKCLVVLKDLIELCQSGPKEEQQKVLMFVYHANQVRQNKLQITAKSTNNLLIEAFCNFKECKVDNMPCVLEQAVRYCTSIECSKPPQTPHTPSIQSKATKDSSKYDVVPTSKNSDATPTTSKNNDIPTTSKDSDGTPTTSRISDLILNTIRKTVTDDANPLRGMTATTFADQFKHFATSFSARKEVTTTKATKRVLNLGHETKESKKPLLQVLSDEEPEATILDQRRSDESKLNTKDTSISLKGIKEKTHAIVKASISLSRQEPLIKDSLAFSSHVADPVTKQVSSTTLESVPKAVPIKTSPPKGTGSSNVSGIISSFSKANAVAYSMSTSPPKGSAGSGLMIPFSRIALGASQQIKVSSSSSICCSSSSSSCSGSIQSDASKSNQGLSGIHAKVLPYMSTEEKEKLKSSLLHLKKN